jgi:protein TonB
VVGVAASLLAHFALAAWLWQWSFASGPPPGAASRMIEVRLLIAPSPSATAREPPRPGVAPRRSSPGDRPVPSPARTAVVARPAAPAGAAPPSSTPAATASTPEAVIEASRPPSSVPPAAEERAPAEDSALEEEYRQRLWLAISAAKPPGIRLAGEAVVSFSLDASGQIRSLEILRSSGNVLLDKLALTCVRRAAPLPPPPPALATPTPRMVIAIQFR